jgi:hypothetical protein
MVKGLGLGLFLALIALTAFGQQKEQDRVANAGKVMQEIVKVPEDIPQSILDKSPQNKSTADFRSKLPLAVATSEDGI